MPTPQEIERRFWRALKSDRVVMLGVDGVGDGHAQPMTAMLDGDAEQGPIWFFTTKDNTIVKEMDQGRRATAHFVAKGHELFASIHGSLSLERDWGMVDRLWNRWAAAWYEGKDDPRLELIRLDPEHAQIWLDETSMFAGLKLLLGRDPKKDYKDKVADVRLT